MAIRRVLPAGIAAYSLLISQAAFGDWIDFVSTEISASEGVGNASISLTRSAATSGSAFAYLSVQDVTTDGTDYVFSPGEIDGDFNVPEITYQAGWSGAVLWPNEDSAGRILAGGLWDSVVGSPSSCVSFLTVLKTRRSSSI